MYINYKEILYIKRQVRIYKNVYKIRFIFFKYRFDPVPGIHHFKNSIQRYHRRIKTTQERRWALAHKKYIRNKRSYTAIPNAWDDIKNKSLHIKNWKRTKKRKQWMQNY